MSTKKHLFIEAAQEYIGDSCLTVGTNLTSIGSRVAAREALVFIDKITHGATEEEKAQAIAKIHAVYPGIHNDDPGVVELEHLAWQLEGLEFLEHSSEKDKDGNWVITLGKDFFTNIRERVLKASQAYEAVKHKLSLSQAALKVFQDGTVTKPWTPGIKRVPGSMKTCGHGYIQGQACYACGIVDAGDLKQ